MEPIDDDLTWFARNPHRCFRMREATHEERAPLLTEAALIDDMVTSLWSTASNAAQPTGSACSLRQRDFGEPRRECGGINGACSLTSSVTNLFMPAEARLRRLSHDRL
jgi:hypothetical protein